MIEALLLSEEELAALRADTQAAARLANRWLAARQAQPTRPADQDDSTPENTPGE